MEARLESAGTGALPAAGGAAPWVQRPVLWAGAAGGAAVFCTGLLGATAAGWGYALLLLAGVLLVAATLVVGVLALSTLGDGETLGSWSKHGFLAGIWMYAWGVCALGGYFARETLQGRMETHWIVFGLAALAALIALDVGLYKRLVAYNRVSWERYRPYLSRAEAEPAAMRHTLIGEVVLQRTLYRTSTLRWWRHTLIFWGFMLMFLTELLAVVFRDAVPAFGWHDVWREPGHPLRMAFRFAYDFSGSMVLLGCVLALFWRWRVNGTAEQKYSDTPTVVFLLAVIVSGFMVEATRIAAVPPDSQTWASFAGLIAARAFGSMLPAAAERPLWYVHTIGSCLFIGYVPLKRLVHSCATPIGRLMNSQRQLLAARKRGVLTGLMQQRALRR
jgi:nitrate reductase gamma subunit